MKKWKYFLLWFVCFCFIDTVCGFIKSLAEKGMLNKWVFVLVALAILVVGWLGVFVGAKSLKKQKTEKRNGWIVSFICFFVVLSVCIPFDVIKYSLENNMLNKYYFFGIGCVLMFIGWVIGRLDEILPKQKKTRN